jgi:hypothetical protein
MQCRHLEETHLRIYCVDLVTRMFLEALPIFLLPPRKGESGGVRIGLRRPLRAAQLGNLPRSFVQ